MKSTGMIATLALAAVFAVAVSGCRNGAGNGPDENVPTTQPSTGSGSATAEADDASTESTESTESTDESATETADTSAEQQSSAAQPVNQFCAVEQQHPSDAKVTYAHDGKVFSFCCEDCIETFKKDPAQYTDAR